MKGQMDEAQMSDGKPGDHFFNGNFEASSVTAKFLENTNSFSTSCAGAVQPAEQATA
jgi:hypothetical protein